MDTSSFYTNYRLLTNFILLSKKWIPSFLSNYWSSNSYWYLWRIRTNWYFWRNFNLITANYHKFKLPKETYTVTYCFFDSTGSCDTTFKTYNYFVKDNKVFTDDTSIRFKLNFSEGSLTLIDKVQETNINLKVGYPNFGKYRSEYTGTSSESSNKGERITGLTKDIGNLRIMVYENLPKFEYKFERLFEKYLDRIK